jgi:hypothetical protein
MQAFYIVFMVIIAVAVWMLAAGGLIQEFVTEAITTNGYTGLIAFFLANMNLWIFLGILIGTFVLLRGAT